MAYCSMTDCKCSSVGSSSSFKSNISIALSACLSRSNKFASSPVISVMLLPPDNSLNLFLSSSLICLSSFSNREAREETLASSG